MEEKGTAGLSVEILHLEQIPQANIPQGYACGFSYTIRINNDTDGTVTLLGRKWMIKQADGTVETVEGDGVVGLQPVLEPGESHVYTSYCLLVGTHGAMWGWYIGTSADGGPVLWKIPRFDMSIDQDG